MHKPSETPLYPPLFSDIEPLPAPCPPVIDGRTVAVSYLMRYVSNLSFYKPGANGPEKICIPEANMVNGFPDYEKFISLPALAVLAGKVTYQPNSLTPFIVEDTVDVYCKGHVLHIHDEHNETISLELWAAKQSDIRAFVAGFAAAFQPSQALTGLRFVMKEYYDTPVVFTLLSSQITEDPDAALNRRRAIIEIDMRFNVGSLEPINGIRPKVQINTTLRSNRFERLCGVDSFYILIYEVKHGWLHKALRL